MKKLILSFLALTITGSSFAQCTANYDFGANPFGVYPDPTLEQNFATGYLNVPYEDILHLKVPTDASAFDKTFPALPIQKISVESIVVFLGEFQLTLAQLGLSYQCNNAGVLPDPCAFQGGQQGCAAITGTPTQAGTFNMNVNLIIDVGFAQFPFNYDGYTLVIETDQSVQTSSPWAFRVEQNAPNPFSEVATINYELPYSGEVSLRVMNLMGAVVFEKTTMGKVGPGKFKLTADQIPAGIYLYSVEFGNEKVTKRMVINK